MSCPSRSTRPLTRAPGTVSCIRLRQRSSVDLPHPEGPMTAVTARDGKARSTPRTAWTLPNHASSDSAASRTSCPAPSAAALRGVSVTRGESAGPTCSVAVAMVPRARDEPGRDADDENEPDENEGAGPGEGVPLVIGADGVGEDLQRQRGDRLVGAHRPEL